MQLIQVERMTKLGRLGEVLAAERLKEYGFTEIEDLNERRTNYPFADIIASRDGTRFLIGVKTRNEMRQGDVGLNASYNLVLVPNAVNALLKQQGKSTDQITRLLYEQIAALASNHDATPAWVTVAIRPRASTYSAYFGLVSAIGNKRSVPMTPKACESYLCIGRDIADQRVTADLLN